MPPCLHTWIRARPPAVAATIYLHWTATGYDWIRPGHYHRIIGGDGRVHRLHALTADLPAHTWRRNSNSVALACACMGGRPDPWLQPPTEAQLTGMCAEAARILHGWGLTPDQVSLQRVMTHAEAASNRDGRVMHDNYGPVIWGGTGERWDLLQLERDGPTNGCLVEIDAEGRSWAPAADLLERYEIPHVWDAVQRRLLIGSRDVVPTYRDDSIQADVGWPLVEITLQDSQAAVIMSGILRDGRVWCRVVEFAEEFGISVQFSPLVLQDRRGG